MEDKRYDPYTGYEIKDKDQRQEDQSRYENENMRYNHYNTQQEANVDQQAQTSGIALAAMILGIISLPIYSVLLHTDCDHHWNRSDHLFCSDSKSQ